MISLRFNITSSLQYVIQIIVVLLCAFLFSSGCSKAITPVPETEIYESITTPTKTATEETAITSPTNSPPDITQEQPRGGIGGAGQLFSSSTYSNEIPDNIMKEIGYFERGGGGELSCDEGNPKLVNLRTKGDFLEFGKGELYQPTEFMTCGWNKNEKVHISSYYPDGRVLTDELYPDEDTKIIFKTVPDFDDPPGQYQVIMEGSSGRVEASYELVDLGRAGLSQLENRMLLYHFAPNEYVNIYAYRIQGFYKNWRHFLGWQNYQVDPNGKLTVHVSPEFQSEDIIFMATGDVSGIPEEFWEDPTCNYGAPKRLKVGSQARTITTEIPFSRDYEDLGNYNVRSFSLGSSFNVLDGPICGEDVVYWQASFEDGSKGWIAEGKKSYNDGTLVYYIEPYDAQSPDIITSSCPDAPPQRVQVGERAFVCTKNDRLIVRKNPKKKATEITRIEPGTQLVIIDGPKCANKWSWWRVETEFGDKGWVSEGGDSIDPYYICPLE